MQLSNCIVQFQDITSTPCIPLAPSISQVSSPMFCLLLLSPLTRSPFLSEKGIGGSLITGIHRSLTSGKTSRRQKVAVYVSGRRSALCMTERQRRERRRARRHCRTACKQRAGHSRARFLGSCASAEPLPGGGSGGRQQ